MIGINELYSIRKDLNITQENAAKILNISRRSYQKYEKLNDEFNDKYDYLVFLFKKKTNIDEEHGLLTLDFIKNTVSSVFDQYDVNYCYLFGSYAKGYARETSDVDLFIDTSVTGIDYFGLIEELREALHKRIDLVNFRDLKEKGQVINDVLKDGIKIYG